MAINQTLKLIIGSLMTLLIFSINLQAQSNNIWTFKQEAEFRFSGERLIQASEYQTMELNEHALRSMLINAPMEFTSEAKNQPIVFPLAMPDGSIQYFNVVKTRLMHPDLASRYPTIQTFSGKGIDDPTASLKMDIGENGFHAIIHSTNGTVYIDPYSNGVEPYYMSYEKKNFRTLKEFNCGVIDEINAHDEGLTRGPAAGEELRVYRLAISTTGEYYQYFGSTASTLSAVVTTINRINGIFERDVAVRLELIANTDLLFFSNPATDPFSGSDGAHLGQNQVATNNIIGSGNYDMGHVFNYGGGGIASLGSVCTGQKAQGYTAGAPPVGDPFDVDYVSHEMGHQFGARHTFNSVAGGCNGNRSGSAAYEPGSGTTIMGYAGLCAPDNVSGVSDDYFHNKSLTEIESHITSTSCASIVSTGNSAPVVDAGLSGTTIPISTPFELTGSATDADGDDLTYCWEQYDLGPGGAPNSPSGNAPLFRSFDPSTSPTRVFPRIQDVIFNISTFGERLPDYNRNMNFRMTVRDNNSAGGGFDYASASFTVTDQAGPFLVTEPNTAITWTAGEYVEVTWDVANTDQTPVSCSNVDLFLSNNGGSIYNTVLATGVPNTGSAIVLVPNLPGPGKRVKVKASDNVFFDISNTNFTIADAATAEFVFYSPESELALCGSSNVSYEVYVGATMGFNETVNFTADGSALPMGTTINLSNSSFTPPNNLNMDIIPSGTIPAGTYTIPITGTSTSQTTSFDLTLTVYDTSPLAISLVSPANGDVDVVLEPVITWMADVNAFSYELEIATDGSFSNIVHSATNIIGTSYSVPAGELDNNTDYFWRVRGLNPFCGDGPYSSTFSFISDRTVCIIFTASQDLPLPITFSGTPTVYSPLSVGASWSTNDVNILNVEGDHNWISQLNFFIESPSGTVVDLYPQRCANQDDFSFSFDDEAAPGTPPCPPTDGGTYQPTGNLSDFNGEPVFGTWKLGITDNVNGTGGTLDGWKLEICYNAGLVGTEEIQTIQSMKVFPNPATDVVNFELDLEKAQNYRMDIISIDGKQIHEQLNGQFHQGVNQLQFNTNQWVPGMYIYRIFTEDSTQAQTGKFVIMP